MRHRGARHRDAYARVGIGSGAGLVFAAILAGCAADSDWMPPSAGHPGPLAHVWIAQPAPTLPPELTRPGATPKVHVFAGQTLGYELTSDAPGTYRFRWTTDNLANHTGVRRFTGSVWTPGHFTSLAPGCSDTSCELEPEDHVSNIEHVAGGERIDWDTLAKDAWDGFSFTTDGAPLRFDVQIDGRARPETLDLVTWSQPEARSIPLSNHPVPETRL